MVVFPWEGQRHPRNQRTPPYLPQGMTTPYDPSWGRHILLLLQEPAFGFMLVEEAIEEKKGTIMPEPYIQREIADILGWVEKAFTDGRIKGLALVAVNDEGGFRESIVFGAG